MGKKKGFLKKLILMLLANAAGLYLAALLLPSVEIALDWKNFAIVAGAQIHFYVVEGAMLLAQKGGRYNGAPPVPTKRYDFLVTWQFIGLAQ